MTQNCNRNTSFFSFPTILNLIFKISFLSLKLKIFLKKLNYHQKVFFFLPRPWYNNDTTRQSQIGNNPALHHQQQQKWSFFNWMQVLHNITFLCSRIDDLRISVLVIHRFICIQVSGHHVTVGQDCRCNWQGADGIEISFFEIALHFCQLRAVLDDVLDGVKRLRKFNE